MLTIAQLIALATNAGWSGSDVGTAVAIALAESGGASKYNPEIKAGAAPGQGSYGIWQIYLTAHPEFNPQQLLADPQYNANAAFQVFQQAGNSFLPWTTFKYGQYLGFLGQVNAVLASSSPAPATDGTIAPDGSSTVTDGTTGIDQTTGASIAGDGLTNYWPLLLAGGFALVLALRG